MRSQLMKVISLPLIAVTAIGSLGVFASSTASPQEAWLHFISPPDTRMEWSAPLQTQENSGLAKVRQNMGEAGAGCFEKARDGFPALQQDLVVLFMAVLAISALHFQRVSEMPGARGGEIRAP